MKSSAMVKHMQPSLVGVNLYRNYGNKGIIFVIILDTTTRTNNQVSNSNFGCLSNDKPAAGL